MKELLAYLLETLACSGVLLVAYGILLDRRVRFPVCRAYLPLAMLAAAVIPMLKIPVWSGGVVYVDTSLVTAGDVVVSGAVVEEPAGFDWMTFTMAFYAVGCVSVLLLMAMQFVRMYRLRREGERMRVGRFDIVKTPVNIASFSFFRTIYVSADTPAADMETIIAHEASHIAHRHSVERVAMGLLKAAMWWNPFVWIAERRLVEVQEYEADSDVIASGFDSSKYVNTLLKHLFGYSPDIANGLRDSLTKKRLKMMTTKTGGRYALLRMAAIIPVMAGLLAAFSFTARAAEVRYVNTNLQGTETTSSEAVAAATADSLADKEEPIYILRGSVRVDRDSLDKINVDSIKSIAVFKTPDAEELKNLNLTDEEIARGVVIVEINGDGNKESVSASVVTAGDAADTVVVVDKELLDALNGKPVSVNGINMTYVVDGNKVSDAAAMPGIEFRAKKLADWSFDKLSADDIKSIERSVDRARYILKNSKYMTGAEIVVNGKELRERLAGLDGDIAAQMEILRKSLSNLNVDMKNTSDKGSNIMLWNSVGKTESAEDGDGKSGKMTVNSKSISVVSTSGGKTDGMVAWNDNICLMDSGMLLVVDGKEIDVREFGNVNLPDIAAVNVLKGEAAVSKYGDKAANGAIEITTRSGGGGDVSTGK